ncbi:MAG: DUF2846 domain-containing protein [Bacteroidetes bacterium]|nr:MAG: DUF2846 domain-containing protein [Bacteroidota bacterium]
MKLLLTAILVATVFGLSARTLNSPKPYVDSSFIYIYRVGQFAGAGANWSIFVDEQKICKLSNNKFIKMPAKPGKHVISAKIGGVGMFKKETDVEIEVEPGGSNYVACNIKSSITRARLEMIEVTKSSANKQMEKMTLDNCQESIDQGK